MKAITIISLSILLLTNIANAKNIKVNKTKKIENSKLIECGKFAETLALKIAETTYSKSEGINPKEKPTPPFQIGSLDPKHVQNYLPFKKSNKSGTNEVVYASSVFTNNENWECSYYVTIEIQGEDCRFEKIQMNNCAGGVHYPAQ